MRKILVVAVFAMTALFVIQSRSSGQRTNRPLAQRVQLTQPVSQEQTTDMNARSQSGRPFTPEEKAQLIERLSANQQLAVRFRDQRHRVLSVTVAPDDKATTAAQMPERRIASVVIFNYTLGRATRLFVDAASGEVLNEEPVRGRPQSSAEEIAEASRIIRDDPALARMTEADSVLQGGFIVDGPPKASPQHRFIQMQVLSPDRLHLRRVVIVDLTAAKIVSSTVN